MTGKTRHCLLFCSVLYSWYGGQLVKPVSLTLEKKSPSRQELWLFKPCVLAAQRESWGCLVETRHRQLCYEFAFPYEGFYNAFEHLASALLELTYTRSALDQVVELQFGKTGAKPRGPPALACHYNTRNKSYFAYMTALGRRRKDSSE